MDDLALACLRVGGMTCYSCVQTLETHLQATPGVKLACVSDDRETCVCKVRNTIIDNRLLDLTYLYIFIL